MFDSRFRRALRAARKREETAYDMGRDYAQNGATEKNCHYINFLTEKGRDDWVRGRDEYLAEHGMVESDIPGYKRIE